MKLLYYLTVLTNVKVILRFYNFSKCLILSLVTLRIKSLTILSQVDVFACFYLFSSCGYEAISTEYQDLQTHIL